MKVGLVSYRSENKNKTAGSTTKKSTRRQKARRSLYASVRLSYRDLTHCVGIMISIKIWRFQSIPMR